MSIFCRDALRRASFKYMAWLTSAGLIAGTVYLHYRGAPLSSVWPLLSVYYFIVLAHVLFRLKNYGKAAIMAPDMFFLLVYTLFHLGYVTFYALGIVPYDDEIFMYEAAIPRSIFIIILGLVSFLFGYEVLGLKGGRAATQSRIKVPNQSWCVAGAAIMLAALLINRKFVGLWRKK